MRIELHTPLMPVRDSRRPMFGVLAKAPDYPVDLLVGEQVEIEGKSYRLLEAKSGGRIVPGCMLQVLVERL